MGETGVANTRGWFVPADELQARREAMRARLGRICPELGDPPAAVIDCPPGWSALLAELLARSRLALSPAERRRFRWQRLGCAQGLLSARYRHAPDHLVDLIEEISARSGRTCEVCGANGRVQHIVDRVSTRCPGHRIAEILSAVPSSGPGPHWLDRPHPQLDHAVPAALMATPEGRRRVLEVLLEDMVVREPVRLDGERRATVAAVVDGLKARLGAEVRDARLLRGAAGRPEVGVVVVLQEEATVRAWMSFAREMADAVALSPITPQEWADPLDSYRPMMLIRARRFEPSLLLEPPAVDPTAPEPDLLLDDAAERDLISAIDRLGRD